MAVEAKDTFNFIAATRNQLGNNVGDDEREFAVEVFRSNLERI
jgi:hypothetical protein